MKFLFLIPGTSNYFCGTCLRDQALARGLRALGHTVEIACLYLPMHLEEDDAVPPPLFFGGVNCYLQQKFRFFRASPRWIDAVFDAPPLLRAAGRRAGMTRPEELGEMTLSMLRGEAGLQAKEVRRLVRWIAETSRPDVVVFSNAMLLGSAPALRRALPAVKIHCTLQGEDTFIESLPDFHAREAWRLIEENGRAVSAFVAVSDFYREKMIARIGLAPERVTRIHNGIELDGILGVPDRRGPPTVAFLSRLCRPKGIHTFLEAFRLIRRAPAHAGLRAIAGGSCTAEDERLVRELLDGLGPADAAAVSIRPNLRRADKLALLREAHLLTTPVHYEEAFGLYIPEALACGTPVVLADKGSFPELVRATGGGLLYQPDTPQGLADAWAGALADPAKLRELGRRGAETVRRDFSARRMAEAVADLARR